MAAVKDRERMTLYVDGNLVAGMRVPGEFCSAARDFALGEDSPLYGKQ